VGGSSVVSKTTVNSIWQKMRLMSLAKQTIQLFIQITVEHGTVSESAARYIEWPTAFVRRKTSDFRRRRRAIDVYRVSLRVFVVFRQAIPSRNWFNPRFDGRPSSCFRFRSRIARSDEKRLSRDRSREGSSGDQTRRNVAAIRAHVGEESVLEAMLVAGGTYIPVFIIYVIATFLYGLTNERPRSRPRSRAPRYDGVSDLCLTSSNRRAYITA